MDLEKKVTNKCGVCGGPFNLIGFAHTPTDCVFYLMQVITNLELRLAYLEREALGRE